MATFWQKYVESGYIFFMLAILGFLVIPSVRKDRKHSREPEFEENAILLSRKMGAGRSGKNVYDIWYGTFETDSGRILELEIPRQLYYTLQDGSRGLLHWKGEKLEDFKEEK